jgi:hypothetical protein
MFSLLTFLLPTQIAGGNIIQLLDGEAELGLEDGDQVVIDAASRARSWQNSRPPEIERAAMLPSH